MTRSLVGPAVLCALLATTSLAGADNVETLGSDDLNGALYRITYDGK